MNNTFDALKDRFSPHGVKIDYATLPPTLYHYTDAGGVAGMLINGAIWATEFRHLNDRSEIEHTRNIVRDILTQRQSVNPSNLLRKLYAGALAKLEKPQQDTEVFFFSLSEDEDSLSQWRGYARDGCGFTLGFNTQMLWATSEEPDAGFGICRVEYRVDVQRRGMEAALGAIEKALVTAVKKDEQAELDLLDKAIETFDVIVWNRAVANKHASFADEREWRLFAFVEGAGLAHIKVRVRDRLLIPYLTFSAKELGGTDGKLPVRRICIGPGFNDQLQLRPVLSLCRNNGYDTVETYFADAPYRAS